MFETCPEIHGDGSELDFDFHVAFLVLEIDRNRDDQVQASVAARFRVLDVVFLLDECDVILLKQASA